MYSYGEFSESLLHQWVPGAKKEFYAPCAGSSAALGWFRDLRGAEHAPAEALSRRTRKPALDVSSVHSGHMRAFTAAEVECDNLRESPSEEDL